MTAQTLAASFDLLRRQWAMVADMTTRGIAATMPPLPHVSTTDQRAAWLREAIERNGLADLKVRPSKTETWAQAFERVNGEPL